MIKTLLLTASATLLLTGPAFAQTTHGIAAVVNDDIVTTHDLRQRTLFMIATTGIERTEEAIARAQQQALRNLVDEHIQIQESDKYEQTISDEEINQSVARLIGRNGLDPNEVVQRIINGLYGSRIRISDAQIDETLNRLTANASKPNYRVAEIYIEATEDIGGMDGAMEGARAMVKQVADGAPFPLLAQQFSSSPTAAKGGDMGWVREGELRPELDQIIQQMEKGNLSKPIQVPGGVYVIALLDKKISEADTVYKLKQVRIDNEDVAAATSQLIALKDTLKSCDVLKEDVDALDGVEQADMGEIKSSELTDSVLSVLESTDVGSLSDPIERPGGAASIMVCSREASGTDIPTRDQIEDRLMDQQLAQASKRHLRDLRRSATVVVR
jgi:peptidyl-prolyl cis-trans isomerase SurA